MVAPLTLVRKFSLFWFLPLPLLAAGVGWLIAGLPSQSLGLRARQIAPGQVRIEWDRSPAVLSAASAALEIRDGESDVEVPLDAERLRNSTLTYAQETANVSVRMRVIPSNARTAIVESVYIVAPPPEHQPPIQVASSNAAAPPLIRFIAPELPPDVPDEPIPQSAEGASDRVTAPRRALVLPSTPSATAPPPIALPAPPLVAANTTAPVAVALNLPVPKPVIVPKPAITPQARSGRLIWTGSLERRGVVEIEGSRPTVGSLTGELPGLNVSMRVSPAEFVAGGLVVYTADRAAARRTEPASKANGWNATRFEWDPERARQIVVLESPNASNEFKRLALRSDARNCSVIVVDWSVP
jgi:hypothetical protein